MTWRVTFWASPWISMNKPQVYQMSPLLLLEWSAFLACMGTESFIVGRLCFWTKCWSIQEMSALLSTNTQILMTFMECEGMISWMGICIDFVSNHTVILAHTGERRGHCIMEVLPFKNPWEWRKFCEWFPHHCHLPLASSGVPPVTIAHSFLLSLVFLWSLPASPLVGCSILTGCTFFHSDSSLRLRS